MGEGLDRIFRDCQQGKLGCTDCKGNLAEILVKNFAPFRQKRKELEKDEHHIEEILKEGKKKARQVARATFHQVREVMQMP